MKRSTACIILAVTLGACSPSATIKVTNTLQVPRKGEIAEIRLKDIPGRIGSEFIIYDSHCNEIPYQMTSAGTLIFQTDVPPSTTSVYKIRRGKPTPVRPKVYGRKFPEHKDNMNWENDLAAYVAYGPALQQSGERGFGYDVWTKSVDTLVIEERNRLRDLGKSLHRDHGNGMDAYIVANTLGAGTAALLADDGSIIFPWAWSDYAIIDNGPLRFTVSLTYNPATIGNDKSVIERRVITLDAGSDLNKTTVTYEGLTTSRHVAPGIVVHRQNPYGETADQRRGIIAYADSTDNASNGNGVIYVGAIVQDRPVKITYRPIDEAARDALGHLLAVGEYMPGDTLTYYWGSAWSKNPTGPKSTIQWLNRLRDKADRIAHPLKTSVK